MKSDLTGSNEISLRSLSEEVQLEADELIKTQEKILNMLQIKNKKVLQMIQGLDDHCRLADSHFSRLREKKEKGENFFVEFEKTLQNIQDFSGIRRILKLLALAGIFDCCCVVSGLWESLEILIEADKEVKRFKGRRIERETEVKSLELNVEMLRCELMTLNEKEEILNDVFESYESNIRKCCIEKPLIFNGMMQEEMIQRRSHDRLQLLCSCPNPDQKISENFQYELSEKQVILTKNDKKSVFSFSSILTDPGQLLDRITPLIPSVFSGNKVTIFNLSHKTSFQGAKNHSSDFFSIIISTLSLLFSKSSQLENHSLKITINSTFLQIKQNLFQDLLNDSTIEFLSSLTKLELLPSNFSETLSKFFKKTEKEFHASHLIFSTILNVKVGNFEHSGILSFVHLAEVDMLKLFSDSQDWLAKDFAGLSSVVQQFSRKCESFSFRSSKLTEALEGKIDQLSDVLFVVNLDLGHEPQQAIKTLNFAQRLKMSILE